VGVYQPFAGSYCWANEPRTCGSALRRGIQYKHQNGIDQGDDVENFGANSSHVSWGFNLEDYVKVRERLWQGKRNRYRSRASKNKLWRLGGD